VDVGPPSRATITVATTTSQTIHRAYGTYVNHPPGASPWFASFAHYNLARTLQRSGDVDAAAVLYEQAGAESRAVGADLPTSRAACCSWPSRAAPGHAHRSPSPP
jgi:hypothetical protein